MRPRAVVTIRFAPEYTTVSPFEAARNGGDNPHLDGAQVEKRLTVSFQPSFVASGFLFSG
jgi:hypothetical protein